MSALQSYVEFRKRFSFYKRYARNSCQSDSDLLTDLTKIESMIVSEMGADLLERLKVTKPCSPLDAVEQLSCV